MIVGESMEASLLEYDAEKGWLGTTGKSADSVSSLVLVFSSLSRESTLEALRSLRDSYPGAVIMGCSTAGEILDTRFLEQGMVALVVRFEHARLALECRRNGSDADAFGIGKSLAEALSREEKPRTLFVLSEGLGINASDLMRGFNAVLQGEIPVTGGLAGDATRFQSTWVIGEDQIHEDMVCALGIYGARLGVAHGSCGGWDVLGPERIVTRSDGNVLYELDDQPALALYKKYLGERARELPASGLLFPLALRAEQEQTEQKVRTILGVNEEEQSLTFAGDIPQGGLVQLMHANFDRLIDGAEDAAGCMDLSSYAGGPLCCIAISCVGRHLVLGPRVEEEIEAVREKLPEQTRQIGFYSYGELSPLASGLCDLHNQTMTLTLWWEY
ncbi:FIST signal transduction protein [Thiolapillus sp.]